jgi:hypothetical protein
MPNQRITDLLTQALPGLTHPGVDGQGSIQLPVAAFRAAATLPPQVAEQFAADAALPTANIAQLFAEAIIHLIEQGGDSEIVPRAELNALRANSTTIAPTRQVEFHCLACGTMLFGAQLRDSNTDKPRLAGPGLIAAVSSLNPQCPHRAA